jgi:hypothetical protein
MWMHLGKEESLIKILHLKVVGLKYIPFIRNQRDCCLHSLVRKCLCLKIIQY